MSDYIKTTYHHIITHRQAHIPPHLTAWSTVAWLWRCSLARH